MFPKSHKHNCNGVNKHYSTLEDLRTFLVLLIGTVSGLFLCKSLLNSLSAMLLRLFKMKMKNLLTVS